MNHHKLLQHHIKAIEETFIDAVTDIHDAHKQKQAGESYKVNQRNQCFEALRKYVTSKDRNREDRLISYMMSIFREDLK